MFDLPANLVVSIRLYVAVSVGLLVDNLQMNGRTLLLQVFLFEEEAKQRRTNGDTVVGSINHDVKLLFHNHLLFLP
jgi:riboflavin synthase